MTNWKTTAFGIGGAVIFIALCWFTNHTITLSEITIAASIAGIGVAASDAKTDVAAVAGQIAELPVLKGSLAKTIVPIADDAVSLLDASHPTNQLLGDIKTGLDTINSTLSAQAAPPSATNASAAPATSK